MLFLNTTAALLVALATASLAQTYLPVPDNSTYYNPVMPGWHSDPSCTRVEDTFFCTASTFIAFPGLPIYASKDLTSWKLVSHAWNRESQLPGLLRVTARQVDGMYAATLRYHEGVFHVVVTYVGGNMNLGNDSGLLFSSADPYSDEAWGDPLRFEVPGIDPDLFWDDDADETLYVTTQGGYDVLELDIATGNTTEPVRVWNGTGGSYPEGPHMFKKDGFYYLFAAEGGTEQNHKQVIARARDIYGPYESYAGNPVLSNANTTQYFQAVGHADMFTDVQGNWWGTALAGRGGPQLKSWPMNREGVLYPITWNEGEWPILEPVRGDMSGWPLPAVNRDVPGTGSFLGDPDMIDFQPGSSLPNHFFYWREPPKDTFVVSPATQPGTLQITPTRANLSGSDEITGADGLAAVFRRQTHTLFSASVDLTFTPQYPGHEAGLTLFHTQAEHVDAYLSLPSHVDNTTAHSARPVIRLRSEGHGAAPNTSLPLVNTTTPLPASWPTCVGAEDTVRFYLRADSETQYSFHASPPCNPSLAIELGSVSAAAASGNTETLVRYFTGALVGVFATCTGAGSNGTACPGGNAANAHFSRWRYEGHSQMVDYDVLVDASAHPRGRWW